MKVEAIIAKSELESGVEKTEAQVKEALEEKLAFLFQVQMSHQQAQNFPKCLESIEMQGQILRQLFKDEVNTKVVSNSFLRAQFQMRVGDFASSCESIEQTIENAEKIKDDFKEDLAIVMAKFMV